MDDLFEKTEALLKSLLSVKTGASKDLMVPAIKPPSFKTPKPTIKQPTANKIPSGLPPPSKKDPTKVAEQLKNPNPGKVNVEVLKMEDNGQWSLEKMKLIKPKHLQLPKNPNISYVSQDRPGVQYAENVGSYNPANDSAYVGMKGVKEEGTVRGNIDISKDVAAHEHQHRLNSLSGKNLNLPGQNERAGSFARQIWDKAQFSPEELEAVRLVNRFNNGYNSEDHDENIASITGFLNGGKANREHILKQIHNHSERSITADSIDPHVRSAFKKLQQVANAIKPQVLKLEDNGQWSLDKKELDPAHGINFVHEHHDLGGVGDLTHIKAVHPIHGVVGETVVEHQADGSLKPSDIQVHPNHRRLGIASAMYAHAEKLTNKKVMPSTAQTADGKALWSKK